MGNFGASLLRLAVMATGAALGVLLAHWYDEMRNTRAEEQSQRDKTRYAQGLSPIERPRLYPIERVQEYQEGQEA